MARDLTIRTADPGDAGAITEIIRGGLEAPLLEYTIYGCNGVQHFVELQLRLRPAVSEYLYLLALLGEEIVGVAEFRRLRGVLFLNYIAVSESARSRGVASALLLAGVERNDDSAEAELQLDVFEENRVAYEWYRRLGLVRRQTTAWFKVSLECGGTLDDVCVHGYPEAEVCQERFGFSRFDVSTPTGRYQVGRLGADWFRLTQPSALLDVQLLAALAQMDAERQVLVLSSEDLIQGASSGSLVTRTYRMGALIAQVERALAGHTEEQ